jgi:hypothetical protein
MLKLIEGIDPSQQFVLGKFQNIEYPLTFAQ